MDFEHARYNMVEQQIRPWEVLDARVLNLMEAMPRHEYVPEEFKSLAYADICVPLPDGQQMAAPRVEARMLQALEIQTSDKILEVGTGSGFVTALLSALGGSVMSVEISPALNALAQRNLQAHGVTGIKLEVGDAVHGWSKHAPYDVIAVTGSIPLLDERFERQLAIGGRLFIIVGERPAMEALLVRRTSAGEWSSESLFETVVPALIGVEEPERFVL